MADRFFLVLVAFAKLRLAAVFGHALGRRVDAFIDDDDSAQRESAKREADNRVAALMIGLGHRVKRDCPRRGLFGLGRLPSEHALAIGAMRFRHPPRLARERPGLWNCSQKVGGVD
jgi:hypothetical protein